MFYFEIIVLARSAALAVCFIDDLGKNDNEKPVGRGLGTCTCKKTISNFLCRHEATALYNRHLSRF